MSGATRRAAIVGAAALLGLSACGAAPPSAERSTRNDPEALSSALLALGPGVEAAEAERMARIAMDHPLALARDWGAVDPPLVHNAQVNLGLKPRGLCYHWANAMYARMFEEDFRSLDLHLGLANADNPFRLEHSSLIVSAAGAPMMSGIVLDPWRLGRGRLFWARAAEDADYRWRPRGEVLAAQGRVPRDRIVLVRE